MDRPIELDEGDWRLIRAFVAVMETGTLSAAARRLGAAQPTLGRQIRELEQRSGGALFYRQGQRLEPTEQALELFPRALDVARALSGLARAFAQTDPEGEARPVRLTLPTLLADEMLPVLMPVLQAAAPRAMFEILPTDAIQDLLRRDADIAIRMAEPRQPDLIARRVGEVKLGLYASQAYGARHGRPDTLQAAARLDWILPRDMEAVRLGAAAAGLTEAPRARPICSDDLRSRLALVRRGLGVSPIHEWIGEGDPGLVRLLPGVSFGDFGVWIVANDDLNRSRTLRAVFDALAMALPPRLKVSPT